MLPESTKPLSVGEHIAIGTSLEHKVRQLEHINRSIQDWCEENWRPQLRAVNIRADTLVIFSSSAAALIQLRLRQTDLLHHLNNRLQLGIKTLDLKVMPSLSPGGGGSLNSPAGPANRPKP